MNVIDAFEAARYEGAMAYRPCWDEDPTLNGMVIVWDEKRGGYFVWYSNAPAPGLCSDDDPRVGQQVLTITTENVMAKDWDVRYPVTDKTPKRLLLCLDKKIRVCQGRAVVYHHNVIGHVISASADDLPNYDVSWQNVLIELTDRGRAFGLQKKWDAGKLDYYLVDVQKVENGRNIRYLALKLMDKE